MTLVLNGVFAWYLQNDAFTLLKVRFKAIREFKWEIQKSVFVLKFQLKIDYKAAAKVNVKSHRKLVNILI